MDTPRLNWLSLKYTTFRSFVFVCVGLDSLVVDKCHLSNECTNGHLETVSTIKIHALKILSAANNY